MVFWGSHQCRVSCRTAAAKTSSVANVTRAQGCSLHTQSLVRGARQHGQETHRGNKGIELWSTKFRPPIPRQLRPERRQQRREITSSSIRTNLSPTLQQDNQPLSYTSQRGIKLQENQINYLNKDSTARKRPLNKDEIPNPSLAEDFRQAMRGVAYPIAVVTNNPENAEHKQGKDDGASDDSGSEALQGLLASSFNTITIKPEPYVSLNIKLPSRTWTAIEEKGEFLVHVMWSSSIAQQFAPDQLGAVANPNLHTFSAVEAMKEMEKGRMFGLRCELTFHHPVADHVLVVGKVLDLLPQSSTSGSSLEREPLLWRNGTWHTARPLEGKT